jgi:hypothetical protein
MLDRDGQQKPKEYSTRKGDSQRPVQQQNRVPVLHMKNQDVRRGRCGAILDTIDIKFEVIW